MIAKNCTIDDLKKALDKVNKDFNDNVMFNRYPEVVLKNQIRFTLRVKDSKGPGHRIGYYKRQKLTSACWHVHGKFFEYLFEINPDAVIISAGKKVTNYNGNWEDWNIGSLMNPFYFSEACDCV